MAVVSANIMSTEDGAWEGSMAAAYVRTYRTRWLVVCDSRHDGPAVVLLSNLLPALYSTYVAGNDVDTQAVLINKTPSLKNRSNTGNSWIVTCEYSTASDNNQSNQDPTLRPPTISGSFVQFMKALDFDIDGKPLRNTLGERFEPSIEIEDSRPVLAVTKIFSSLDYVFFCSYKDAVNSDTFNVRSLTFPPDTCKIQNLSFQEVWINGVSYFEVTVEMEIKPEKWNPKLIANIGLLELKSDGKIDKIVSEGDHGEPLTTAQDLLEDGTRCTGGEPPFMIPFRPYFRKPFVLLHLN